MEERGSVTYRPMTAADYPDVYDLWLHTPGMGLNTTDDSEEGISRYLDRNPRTSFVACEGGRVIGVILAGHDGRRGMIHHTAVLEDHRGRGIGRALAEHALRALGEEGISKVLLVVFGRNTGGNVFWERLGFTARNDLVYRNRSLVELTRIDT